MRFVASLVALCLALTTVRTFAVKVETFTSKDDNKAVALVESHSAFPFEFEAEAAYFGSGDLERGEHGDLLIQDFHGYQGRFHFILTPMTKIGILRLGIGMERYAFSYGGMAAIPNDLSSANLIIGLDTELSDSFLIRVEAQPGFYSTSWDEFGWNTFNVPVIIGGTYIYSSTLQFVFGVGIDAWRQSPVLPGGGVRWKFAPQWTLNAVVPTPRLEYEPNSNLLFFVGADLRAPSYRVEDNFGTVRGDTSLNHASIVYEELRIGGGLDWNLSTAVKLTFEGGYVPHRNFDFHRTQVRYHQDGGIPYLRFGFRAAF